MARSPCRGTTIAPLTGARRPRRSARPSAPPSSSAACAPRVVLFGHTPCQLLHGSPAAWYGPGTVGIDGGAGRGQQINCLIDDGQTFRMHAVPVPQPGALECHRNKRSAWARTGYGPRAMATPVGRTNEEREQRGQHGPPALVSIRDARIGSRSSIRRLTVRSRFAAEFSATRGPAQRSRPWRTWPRIPRAAPAAGVPRHQSCQHFRSPSEDAPSQGRSSPPPRPCSPSVPPALGPAPPCRR